ncbi:interferon-induced transmembrane protein 1-like [Apus apus]|uniref:interferon-induced transmembrane protein 1-like n=1 Tax=Apus apus TaxID=8895 RepID=UPI0021F8ECE6|nr:interferon-induced transmembrane protein 1-like [Apus apus]
MENYPQPISINMQQPYGRNGAGAPMTSFGPTVTTFIQPEPVPNPQDFVLWSFFNTMFCNPFCLGFIALVFSVKARDKKIARDPEGAKSFGIVAKNLNIAAVCLGTLSFILAIVVLAVVFSRIQQYNRL